VIGYLLIRIDLRLTGPRPTGPRGRRLDHPHAGAGGRTPHTRRPSGRCPTRTAERCHSNSHCCLMKRRDLEKRLRHAGWVLPEARGWFTLSVDQSTDGCGGGGSSAHGNQRAACLEDSEIAWGRLTRPNPKGRIAAERMAGPARRCQF
jgi:hypothetical protein